MKKLLLILTFTAFLTHTLLADAKSDIKSMMVSKIDTITNLLQDKALGKPDRDRQIITTINAIFDFKLMAQLSLGKKYWRSMNRSKQQKFTNLFIKKFQKSYLDKLDLYTDETVKINNTQQPKSNRIYLDTTIVGKKDEHKMIYKFYKSKSGDWLIYDLDLIGVSLIQTYRAQFHEILKTKDMDALIEKLETSKI
jgi:phospholipid transport system substrate-binding protein